LKASSIPGPARAARRAFLFLMGIAALMALASRGGPEVIDPLLPEDRMDWPSFMRRQDMTFDRLPGDWTEAPHFGNALIGSMLYQAGETVRLQVFRADVHDHRDDTYGWTAYSRPRLMIGHFSLHPVGRL
jgi:hypothetical protein